MADKANYRNVAIGLDPVFLEGKIWIRNARLEEFELKFYFLPIYGGWRHQMHKLDLKKHHKMHMLGLETQKPDPSADPGLFKIFGSICKALTSNQPCISVWRNCV